MIINMSGVVICSHCLGRGKLKAQQVNGNDTFVICKECEGTGLKVTEAFEEALRESLKEALQSAT